MKKKNIIYQKQTSNANHSMTRSNKFTKKKGIIKQINLENIKLIYKITFCYFIEFIIIFGFIFFIFNKTYYIFHKSNFVVNYYLFTCDFLIIIQVKFFEEKYLQKDCTFELFYR